MTSPTLSEQTTPAPTIRGPLPHPRFRIPLSLFFVTLLSTTAVGMRYMYNFHLGRTPLSSDADILPYGWVVHNLATLSSGLPFSLTLIAILLAHEFGHYFACRNFHVRSSLPYLLPAPSLSGTFGAVIRLKSRVRSRAALIVIGASGPIAGFLVALVTITIGLSRSNYGPTPVMQRVQAPLLISGIHALLRHFTSAVPADQPLLNIVPHPILVASWIGLLITALNLIPAGQLDGGHILYAISPRAHKICSRLVTVALLLMGLFFWCGWILWGIILMLPGMRHPQVPDVREIKTWHYALIPICAAILLFSGSYEPFHGYSLINVLTKLPNRYR